MVNRTKPRRELEAELLGLRERLEEAEDTLHAIRHGEVDALVVSRAGGEVVYTLDGADRPYRVLIEAMSEGALTLSEEGTILYGNARFAELVATPLERVIGTPLCRFVEPGDNQAACGFIARAGAESARLKVSLLRSDGTTVPVQLSARRVDIDDVRPTCVIVTDLTSVVAAEEALRRAHDELERRVEERTAELMRSNELRLRFLAMVSHELRTPLTSIKGFATTLLARDVDWEPEQQRDFINVIDQEADKLTSMISLILDLSSIEVGSLRINPAPVRLSDVMGSALRELRRFTEQHEFTIEMDDDLPPVNADATRVVQVLANLVENAVKYSVPHTRIGITIRRAGREVVFGVTDEGMGIPPEDRPHVFEAFWRSRDVGVSHMKGAGLGLAICKGLVEAHRGRIWLEDRPGPGTTVCFTLQTAEF